MDFNLIDIRITLRADNPEALALWLYGRGADFAAACRSARCRWPSRACQHCSGRGECPWHAVFGQELAADPEALRRHQKPPLPFAFSFPVPQPGTGPARTIERRLVVAGLAIACLDMLLEGFADLLSGEACHQRCELLSVESCDYQGTRARLGQGSLPNVPGNLVVLSSMGIRESRAWDLTRQDIRLVTPLRLLSEGKALTRFSFGLFARSLLRRISSLAYYYGGCRTDCDFRDLARQADAITCLEDHFVQACLSGGGKRLSGIAGHGSFRGDFSGLLPFLALGTYLNTGKSAAFGLGSFTLPEQ